MERNLKYKYSSSPARIYKKDVDLEMFREELNSCTDQLFKRENFARACTEFSEKIKPSPTFMKDTFTELLETSNNMNSPVDPVGDTSPPSPLQEASFGVTPLNNYNEKRFLRNNV